MSQVTAASAPSGPLGRADDARRRLQEAAVLAFAARGFHGTTTRDIAAAAGMSSAALYVHYKSKEDLLYLLSLTGHEETLRIIQAAKEASDHPRQQLVRFVRDFVRHHAIKHTSARIVNYELAALSPEHREHILGLRRQIYGTVRNIVEAGVAQGAFHTPNPRMTALALLSLGIDVTRWYREDGHLSPDDLAEHYCDLALRMVGVGAP